jgi:hypothetical protein
VKYIYIYIYFFFFGIKSKTKKYVFSWMKEFRDFLWAENTRDGHSLSKIFNQVYYFLYKIAVYKSFTLLPELESCLCNNLCHFNGSTFYFCLSI